MASLKSLIPQNVLSAMVEETLRKSLVFGDVVNTNYEGIISSAGDSVLIPVIGDVTISDHAVNDTITYEALDSTQAKLQIDQQKRFAFAVDDVDSRQALIDVAAAYADRAAYQLKDDSDQYIAALHSTAGVTTDLGTTTTPLTITAAATTGSNISAYEVLARIAQGLDNAKVLTDGRWIIIPPWLHGKLVMAGMLQYVAGDANAYTNGSVGRIMGFDVRMSTNVVNYNTTGSKILAGTNQAITFASQILNIETIRLETKFGTGVRGMYVYGAKTVQSSALACATLSTSAG